MEGIEEIRQQNALQEAIPIQLLASQQHAQELQRSTANRGLDSLAYLGRPGTSRTNAANRNGTMTSANQRPRASVRDGRETLHSTLDAFHEDDLSIVASDEEDQSMDGQSLTTATTEQKTPKTAPLDLVRRETKAALTCRFFILILLVISGCLLTVATYRWVTDAQLYLSGNENACFSTGAELQNVYAHSLERNLMNGLQARVKAAFTVSASLTSLVLSLESINSGQGTPVEWPLVTVPHFDARLTGILESSSSSSSNGAMQVQLAPIVVGALKTTFEEFAVAEQLKACSTCDPIEEIINPESALPDDDGTTVPVWQYSPDSTEPVKMLNLLNDELMATSIQNMRTLKAGVLTDIVKTTTAEDAENRQDDDESGEPRVSLIYPLFQDFQQVKVAATLNFIYRWKDLLEEALALLSSIDDGAIYFSLLLESCTGKIESFDISGQNLTYVGSLPAITDTVTTTAASFAVPGGYVYGTSVALLVDESVCNYKVWLVPTELGQGYLTASSGESDNESMNAILYTSLVGSLFLVLLACFLVYDWVMEKRQRVVSNIATKSSAIVENLFPAQVRDRMLQGLKQSHREDQEMPMDTGNSTTAVPGGTAGQVSVKQFLSNDMGMNNNLTGQPIADLFPNTTVLFADIAGFTAWSSQRDPPQVFTLLETLYRSFDVIAKRLKVFKVETIGDCYMAVTGLPNPDEAHAVHMSRFAYQCLVGMKDLIRELEAMLGPGTSDLALRVGLHSGPVTAGVLRGEKSRFQLFGDTVNTASRMESTGMRGKIQISQETADLLMAAGKSHWLRARDEAVVAKGKGELKTYWLDPTKRRRNTKVIRVQPDVSVSGSSVDKPLGPGDVAFDDKYARLIDWNVDVLLHHLARVISNRNRNPPRGTLVNHSSEIALVPAAINDVADVVALPPFDPDSSKFRRIRPDVSMLQQTRADLHEYVKRIATFYRDVPFHNFEHASHVTLCANKLLNRLINSDEYASEEELHNATFGISSDPVTHFAIVFAALIHDVDHTGLPNAQLVKDGHDLAVKFNQRSVAEQNSVHLGWEILMDPRFERLRKCIYQTNVERKRFRQLVINSVLATDIADRQVNEERQMKWDRAFAPTKASEQSGVQIQDDMNRKATVVIEQIIQVSDVAHTMQHWHIYRRWNERLFHEMHEAYSSGHVAVDPSTNWYVGEIGFFEYYLIPLAMKLKDCGVFGASGYEYISYVLKNKKEWERKGRQVVQEMISLYKDAEEEESASSYDSEDDLEYDSPGEMSSSDEEDE